MSNKARTNRLFSRLILACQYTETAVRRCFIKKIFLSNFFKSHRKAPVQESLFNKVAK